MTDKKTKSRKKTDELPTEEGQTGGQAGSFHKTVQANHL